MQLEAGPAGGYSSARIYGGCGAAAAGEREGMTGAEPKGKEGRPAMRNGDSASESRLPTSFALTHTGALAHLRERRGEVEEESERAREREGIGTGPEE